MLNEYEILGDVVLIKLNSSTYGKMFALVSLDKLEKVKKFDSAWYPSFNKNSKSFVVMGVQDNNGKNKSYMLSRWVLDYEGKLFADHINHNTLDNRNLNLRLLNHAQNAQNLNPDKFEKVRGVTWNTKRKKWVAQIIVNGKHVYNKRFVKYDDAVEAVIKARSEYMPFSPEAREKHGA